MTTTPTDEQFEDLAAEAAQAEAVLGPTEEQSKKMTALAHTLVQAEQQVELCEEALERAKEARKKLRHEIVPEFMQEIGQDRVGLPELELDIVLSPYYHANISGDWEEERREAAFDHLVELGHGDVIKVLLTVAFGRHEYDQAMELMEIIKNCGIENVPDPLVTKGVPWNTLTALVKEQVEAGAEDLQLSLIGATVGTIAKIKKR